jgi:hypothetical protein
MSHAALHPKSATYGVPPRLPPVHIGGIDHMYPDGHGQACPDSEGVVTPVGRLRVQREKPKPRYRMRP